MLAGFMSTTLKAWSLTSKCHRLTRRSSAEMNVSPSAHSAMLLTWVRVRGRVLPPAARRQHHLCAVHLGRGHGACSGSRQRPLQERLAACRHWHRVAGATIVLAIRQAPLLA